MLHGLLYIISKKDIKSVVMRFLGGLKNKIIYYIWCKQYATDGLKNIDMKSFLNFLNRLMSVNITIVYKVIEIIYCNLGSTIYTWFDKGT